MIATMRIAVVVALALAMQACSGPEPSSKAAPTSTSPDEVLGAVSPAAVADIERLMESARGKVALVHFWATWCKPCVEEIPELAAFYREQGISDISFIAISLDAVEDIEATVKPFMSKRQVPFPVHVLSERDVDAVSKAVRHEISGGLPTTILYDRQGAVVKVWEGPTTLEELNAAVKPLR